MRHPGEGMTGSPTSLQGHYQVSSQEEVGMTKTFLKQQLHRRILLSDSP